MTQGTLRDVVVINIQIFIEGGFQFGCRGEAGLLDQITDAAIEAFDHTICLRMSGWTETMLNGKRHARLIKGMFSCWLFILAGKAVGELTTIVSEYFLGFHRCGLFHLTQEVSAAAVGLIAVDARRP